MPSQQKILFQWCDIWRMEAVSEAPTQPTSIRWAYEHTTRWYYLRMHTDSGTNPNHNLRYGATLNQCPVLLHYSIWLFLYVGFVYDKLYRLAGHLFMRSSNRHPVSMGNLHLSITAILMTSCCLPGAASPAILILFFLIEPNILLISCSR